LILAGSPLFLACCPSPGLLPVVSGAAGRLGGSRRVSRSRGCRFLVCLAALSWPAVCRRSVAVSVRRLPVSGVVRLPGVGCAASGVVLRACPAAARCSGLPRLLSCGPSWPFRLRVPVRGRRLAGKAKIETLRGDPGWVGCLKPRNAHEMI